MSNKVNSHGVDGREGASWPNYAKPEEKQRLNEITARRSRRDQSEKEDAQRQRVIMWRCIKRQRRAEGKE